MRWRPQKILTEAEVKKGLKYVIGDGLATETMTVFTAGPFMVAMALLLGATNLEIGILAAMPTFTNVFQLLSIWLVRRFNNRRVITVVCSILARLPLIIIGAIFFVAGTMSMTPVIFFLFFLYFFGSVAGPSWNAWMKDLIPENKLGAYFSRRSSYMQILNVVLSLSLAFLVDYIKGKYPQQELNAYMWMFVVAGTVGVIGALVLSKAPEPQSLLGKENIFSLLRRPLKDGNFRRLLTFNSAWVFALNIASPFFTVFMMKTIGLSLSYIIGLSIVSQLASILTIRLWGAFADKYSNKTIIAIGAPLYILCLIGWCFVGIYSRFYMNFSLLVIIHIALGISTAGINLSLNNIGLKLAPANQSIVYLSAKNIITAVFSSIAPLLGGYLADYFSERSVVINMQLTGPHIDKILHLVSLHNFNFLFLIGAVLAFVALEFLITVKETGEVEKDQVVKMMRSTIRNNLKDYFVIGQLITWHEQFLHLFRRRGKNNNGPKRPPLVDH
jgi:MFS family permease